MTHGPILLVDDDPNTLAALRQILAADYRLVFARTGNEALVAVTKHMPSLILLDVEMPGMDGYEVCRQLKLTPAQEHIPVIFVSALTAVGNEARGFEAGCVDYIFKPVSPSLVRARVRTHMSLVRSSRLERSYRDAIRMLGEAGHYNDTDTGDHIWRMAAYARALAKEWGWAAEACELLNLAAPMHDTGKIGIPDAILRKPGPLTVEEWEVMKTHTSIGRDILATSDAPVFQMAAEIAMSHHEKWDGSGYPHGLAGDAIPESARLVAIVDVFDALSNKRPYKESWPDDQVLAAITRGAGRHFDPRMTQVFLGMLPRIMDIRTSFANGGGEPAPAGMMGTWLDSAGLAIPAALAARPHNGGNALGA